ncbi:small, acid-soluble spore protein L [Anoxybacillus sp. PDR2]|nr:small, acid-soluble spore protein L [Anoxybacillus rupiensis]QHC03822.1 small, acid-soluble spore protein L [Anoxybacillus sp. PDR2]
MAKNGGTNRGTKAPSVNPQGYGQDATFSPDPKSELENAAIRSNTKQYEAIRNSTIKSLRWKGCVKWL